MIEKSENEKPVLADIETGEACVIKHANGKDDIFAVVTDIVPTAENSRVVLDIETGRTFTYCENEPVKRLDNAEFYPYGTDIGNK